MLRFGRSVCTLPSITQNILAYPKLSSISDAKVNVTVPSFTLDSLKSNLSSANDIELLELNAIPPIETIFRNISDKDSQHLSSFKVMQIHRGSQQILRLNRSDKSIQSGDRVAYLDLNQYRETLSKIADENANKITGRLGFIFSIAIACSFSYGITSLLL